MKNGFSESLFTSAIYDHLHLHCGYIAHYNKHGYYGEYWGAYARDLHRHAKEDLFSVRPVPKVFYNWESFIRQFNIWGDYRDIGTAMMMVLKSEEDHRRSLEAKYVELFGDDFSVDPVNSTTSQLFLI